MDDGWMDGWTDRQMDRQVHGWAGRCIDGGVGGGG